MFISYNKTDEKGRESESVQQEGYVQKVPAGFGASERVLVLLIIRETQSIVHFAPEGNTMTDGLHQGFDGSLYKTQISHYAVLVVLEPLTAKRNIPRKETKKQKSGKTIHEVGRNSDETTYSNETQSNTNSAFLATIMLAANMGSALPKSLFAKPTHDGDDDDDDSDRRANGFKLIEKDGEALEQVAQRGCGCLIPESVQGQVEWGLEQPGLVNGIPVCDRGVEQDDP
ncbi:hypothetical protein WISP_98872 [Willisornis vidua]|uniref:Uncharacterized protein n=1 Tax=Willisornis vidua TaxID=1566151 RepID=A0ABQ9CZF5_9PASS|nr:hypothetical protein WISP_98872 [Willisornis vidua]